MEKGEVKNVLYAKLKESNIPPVEFAEVFAAIDEL